MKKSVLLVVLAVVLVFAFAATASATSGKFWNYQSDYYSWNGVSGNSIPGGSNVALSSVGANPANPGVHANYLANTAKCGICHSVHRAKAGGVHLLNTATATCAGCHRAGVSTVTNVLVSWQTGGPHSSGSDASCNSRGCHANSPHGVGTSQYKLFAAKLLNNMPLATDSGAKVDMAVAPALANSAASGITVNILNGVTPVDEGTRQAIVVGYTCNSWGCHEQSMLPVVKAGYAEDRLTVYPETAGVEIPKTGHMTGSAATSETLDAFAAVSGCSSCHDQADASTRSGHTFPHSQTPYGASNMGTGRAYLWMGYAGQLGGSLTAMGAGDKASDGACLKCHRSATSGIGITR
jgi:predicted CXXCH cytochrome family protein